MKPILFSTPMVQAILEGQKTQTRRVIKPQPELKENSGFNWKEFAYGKGFSERETDRNFISCVSKIKTGDILWVRETWSLFGWDYMEGFVNIQYKDGVVKHFYPDVDNIEDWIGRKIDKLEKKGFLKTDPEDEEQLTITKKLWEPSIFMPKWACRIFLKVTNVRLERLQDISEPDAVSEGVRYWADEDDVDLLEAIFKNYMTGERNLVSAYSSFRSLWLSINGEASWDANPWVWVYDFKRIEKP